MNNLTKVQEETDSFANDTISLSPYSKKYAKRPTRKTEDRLSCSIESDTDSLSPFLSNRIERVSQYQALQEERKWGKRAQKIRVKRLAKFYCHHQTRRNPFLTADGVRSSKDNRSKFGKNRFTIKQWTGFSKIANKNISGCRVNHSISKSLSLLLAVVSYLVIGAICIQSFQTNRPIHSVSTNITERVISDTNMTKMLPHYKTRCSRLLINTATKPSFWTSAQTAALLISTTAEPSSLSGSVSRRLLLVIYFIPGIVLLLCFLVTYVSLMQESLEKFTNPLFENSSSEDNSSFTKQVLIFFVSLFLTLLLVLLMGIALCLKDRLSSLTSAMFHQSFIIATVGITELRVTNDTQTTISNIFCVILGLGLLSNLLYSGIKALRAAKRVTCTGKPENRGDDSRYSTEVQPGSLNRGWNSDEI
jgi:hypothetical protein